MTRHCYQCGAEWTISGQPGRGERCHQCNCDLRICLNCAHYDPRAAHQCRERRAEPEEAKDKGNFCEYFDFIKRVYAPPSKNNSREDSARQQLKKLFGD